MNRARWESSKCTKEAFLSAKNTIIDFIASLKNSESHYRSARTNGSFFFLIEYTRLEKKHKDCNKEIQRKMVILASKAMIISDTFGMGHL